jgi:hypothetical protein
MGEQYLLKAEFEELRTVAFAGIGAGYAIFGAPLVNPSRLIIITNTTNQSVTLSTNGVTDHLIIPAGSFKLLDISANRSAKDGFYFRTGTQFYQKRTSAAPTTGSIYLETIFAG